MHQCDQSAHKRLNTGNHSACNFKRVCSPLQGWKVMEQNCSYHGSQEAENTNGCIQLVCFYFAFILCRRQSRDERLPLGVGLPSLLNPLWKCLQKDSLTDIPEENLSSLPADSKPIQGDNQHRQSDHPQGWIYKHKFMLEFESLCSVYITEHSKP